MKTLILTTALLVAHPVQYENPVVDETATETTATETEDDIDIWAYIMENYFSAEKIAMYMSWVAYIGTIIGLVANINKLKKANNLTLKNVSDDVQSKLKEVVGNEINKQMQNFAPNILQAQQKTNDVLKIFSEIMALSQENTPESRVAILKLIEELGTIGKEITDNVQELIKQEVEAIEEKKEEIENKLDEIIDEYDGTSI